MMTWQCAGCNKIWQAEELPRECACGCRIVREVTMTPVAPMPVPDAGGIATVVEESASAEPAPSVSMGPQPPWRRAHVQGVAAVCVCAVFGLAAWGAFAWHSALVKRQAETETYVFSTYQPCVDKAKALKAASPDRGEGFGLHLDALSAASSGADAAWNAKNNELCRTFLEKAQAELRWLDEAVPGRAKTAALRVQTEGERSAAEREKAAAFAAEAWASANAAFAKADGLREKGEFASALAAYEVADGCYKKAAGQASEAHSEAAKARFAGLFGQLEAKFELLEMDACQTGLVAAATQDLSALERLTAEERGYLLETEGRRLAETNERLRRYKARLALGLRLVEIESGLVALAQGQGAGQLMLMDSMRGRIDGAVQDAGGKREDQTDMSLKRLADADGKLKEIEASVRAARVADFMAQATGAKKNSEWKKVRENAVDALALDAGNADAQALKKEAQDHLTPTLRVTATVDGQEVAASLSDGASTYTTSSSLTLEQGMSYKYTVTYRASSGARYHADVLKVTADWEGAQTRQIALEPLLITPATFEQALRESAAGSVLELDSGEYCFKKINIDHDLTLRGRGAGKTVIRVGFRLTISRCSVKIENCSVESTGGIAILVDGAGGDVALSNCICKTLSGNTSHVAVWLEDGCKGSIKNCELNGVRLSKRCTCEIADSRVIGANNWGVACSDDSSLKMTFTTVADCKGQGIVLFERTKCEMNDCKFTGNSEGCRLNADSSTVVANRCEFRGNRENGIWDSGHLKLNNCTIAENKKNGFWVGGHLELNNCSISGNCENGIDVLTSGTCEYYNCTFDGNKRKNIDGPERTTQKYSPIQ